MHSRSVGVSVSFGLLLAAHGALSAGVLSNSTDFDWFGISPSSNVTWAPCFDGFKCARLSLPLDHTTPNGPTIEVALQMLPATDTANYNGTILVNPGGPGDSGTQFINSSGAAIQRAYGPEFDYLGFDPRGIGATTPSAQCFDSDEQLNIWNENAAQTLNITDYSIPWAFGRAKVVAQRCAVALGGSGREDLNGTAADWGAGRFMDSASVATDMLRISEKLGQTKVNYLGISYGTVLGQYFAALYPDKIGRMIIDGVADAENYRNADLVNNLESTDTIADAFFTFCHQGGPLSCSLYESTPDAIRVRFNNILAAVDTSPIPLPFAPQGPALLTSTILRGLQFSATYTPATLFPQLADLFLAAETNNKTALAAFVAETSAPVQCTALAPPPWLRQTQALPAIGCSDLKPINDSRAEFDAFLTQSYAVSAVGTPTWAQLRVQCDAWTIRPKTPFTGAFVGNTTTPVLVMSNTFDPVCPLSNAQRVQKRFGNAGLLEVHGYGHTTLLNPSACAMAVARAYLANGTLPAEGTVCQPDAVPFGG